VVRQAQYGRNMLLGEYLWLAYCASLLPGAEPDPTMMRERKQVSSHIQVLKNIFKHHKCCKWPFVSPLASASVTFAWRSPLQIELLLR